MTILGDLQQQLTSLNQYKNQYPAEIKQVTNAINLLKQKDITIRHIDDLRQSSTALDRLAISPNVSTSQYTAIQATRKKIKDLMARTVETLTDYLVNSVTNAKAKSSGEGGDNEEYYAAGALREVHKQGQQFQNLEVNKMIQIAEADVKRWIDKLVTREKVDEHLKNLSFETSKMNAKLMERYKKLLAIVEQQSKPKPVYKKPVSAVDDDWD